MLCAVWIFLTSLGVVVGQPYYTIASGHALVEELAKNYSVSQRPAVTTDVKISFGLSHVTELDIVNQHLGINGFLAIQWNDPRLTWTAASYDNMDELFIFQDSLWTPPLVLFNAAKTMMILSDDGNVDEAPLKVSNTGDVIWLTPVSFEAICTVYISYYPFDKQECSIEVSTWFYSSQEMNITSGSGDSIILDLYEEDGEWDLDSTEAIDTYKILHGFTMPMVRFTMTLSRKYAYYVMNFLFPVIILAFLGTCVFILPASAGKNGFALTILLSLSVVMTMVSNSIPPTSIHISILSIYLLTTYLLVTLEGLVTVIGLIIADYDKQGYKLSPGFQNTVKNTLAPLARYRRAKDEALPHDTEKATSKVTGKTTLGGSGTPNSKVDIALPPVAETNKRRLSIPPAWTSDKPSPPDNDTVADYTYTDVAIMMDRICFVIFSILTTLITFIMMLLLRFGSQ